MPCLFDCGRQGAELTQDYSTSDHHRFRNPDSKNHLRVYPPSSILHLSSIPWVDSRFQNTGNCQQQEDRLSIIFRNRWKVAAPKAHYHCQLTVSHLRTVQLLLELLFVKFGYFFVSCLAQADITYATDSICTSWCVRCFMFDVIFYIVMLVSQ